MAAVQVGVGETGLGQANGMSWKEVMETSMVNLKLVESLVQAIAALSPAEQKLVRSRLLSQSAASYSKQSAIGILALLPGQQLKPVMENNLLQRITQNSEICHGKPCIRGLRYPVEFILELLSSGMTTAEILADYDDLESDDMFAVLLVAARLSQVKS